MTRTARSKSRQGVVLFVVTVVVALASLAAYGFLLTMQGENKASRAAADQLQVAQVAASGEEFVAVWLQGSQAERRALAALYGEAVFTQPVTEPALTGDGSICGRFHIVVPVTVAPGLGNSQSYPDANATTFSGSGAASLSGIGSDGLATSDIARPFRYGVGDESAKLHLRTLLAWDEIWPGAGRKALLQLPGMTESTADAILDWVDQDNSPREFGAEGEYYASRVPRESPLNGIPNSLDDLLKVRGVTPALLLGTTGSHIAVDDSNPKPTANSFTDTAATGQETAPTFFPGSLDASARPWVEFLTVHSAERNVAFDGSPRINIDNPDLAALHGDLLLQFPRELADFVILYRQYGPAPSTEMADQSGTSRAHSGQSVANVDIDLSQPASYRFGSVAELIDAVVMLPPTKSPERGGNDDSQKRESRRVTSPLSSASGPTPDLDNWLDRLTVRHEESIPGRLNILAADPTIILGLPLSDPRIATQILSIRETLSGDLTSVPGTSWLLTAGLLDRDNFLKLSQFLTVGGDVVRFQVVATHAPSSLVDRYEVILDGTVENTQRVYYRDLRRDATPRMFEMFYQAPGTNTPLTSPKLVRAR